MKSISFEELLRVGWLELSALICSASLSENTRKDLFDFFLEKSDQLFESSSGPGEVSAFSIIPKMIHSVSLTENMRKELFELLLKKSDCPGTGKGEIISLIFSPTSAEPTRTDIDLDSKLRLFDAYKPVFEWDIVKVLEGSIRENFPLPIFEKVVEAALSRWYLANVLDPLVRKCLNVMSKTWTCLAGCPGGRDGSDYPVRTSEEEKFYSIAKTTLEKILKWHPGTYYEDREIEQQEARSPIVQKIRDFAEEHVGTYIEAPTGNEYYGYTHYVYPFKENL